MVLTTQIQYIAWGKAMQGFENEQSKTGPICLIPHVLVKNSVQSEAN